MEKQTKNLGHVTAYGYAVSQGYEGTEAEYAQLMASYATVAERAETAAQEAEESAQEVKDVIPEVTAQDNGKVMMVENGEWGAGEVDVLPTVTAQDNGKVLGVVEGQWAKTEPEDGLPSVTSSDNGKVLSVVEGAWAPAEAGSGLPEVTTSDNGDLLSVVDGAWAKSEPGYRVENSETEIAPEQSVTTVSQESVNVGPIAAIVPDPLPDSVNVTFNGTSYANVPQHADASLGGAPAYGDSSFVEYPFVLVVDPGGLFLLTQTAGTYTIAITVQITTVTLDDDFKLAVSNSYMDTTETEKVTIPEQSITTAVQSGVRYPYGSATDFALPADYWHQDLWPTALHVTLNGTEYDLPKVQEQGWEGCYGARNGDDPGFTVYPCFITFGEQDGVGLCSLSTESAGTYTLSATYTEATTAPTEKFKEAVRQSGGGALIVNDDNGYLDKTWQEIFDAYTSGTAVVIRKEIFTDNGGDGDELTVYHSQVAAVCTITITTQGEETVTYYVQDAGNNTYEASSADDYPGTNSWGGGGGGIE